MKRRPSSIAEVGFEYLPEGQLLSQFVDLRPRMGAAYERCVGYSKDFHTHDRVNLAFPRNSSVIRFTTQSPKATLLVDETKVLWMPENVIHRQDTVSTIYDNLAIFPSREVVDESFKLFRKKYGIRAEEPRETTLKKRTPLLQALLQQYFSERILDRRKAKLVEGLTFQILEEVLRIFLCPKRERAALVEGEDSRDLITMRAIRYIESNLFAKLDSKLIAQEARSSVPTLFRKFKLDTGMTPHDYLFRRRMDEAKTLLQQGEHQVTDIALLIGYEEGAAFSKAFKSYFGKSPSAFKRQGE